MSDEQLYRKVGRRYEPVHTTARAIFPAEGVWLVETTPHGHSSYRISELGEVPDPMRLAGVERHREAILAAIRPLWPRCSMWEAADAVIKALEKETRSDA